MRSFEIPGPEFTMLELKIGTGRRADRAGEPIVIDGSTGSVKVIVPDPRTRWGRLWKEALIFIGVAGLLAL